MLTKKSTFLPTAPTSQSASPDESPCEATTPRRRESLGAMLLRKMPHSFLLDSGPTIAPWEGMLRRASAPVTPVAPKPPETQKRPASFSGPATASGPASVKTTTAAQRLASMLVFDGHPEISHDLGRAPREA